MTYNQFSCEAEDCNFITVDEAEFEDHKQFHTTPEHIHSWGYKHKFGKWVCGCGKMAKFFCIYCNEILPENEIPKKALTKIGMQVFYHNDCLNEVESKK